MPPSVTDLAAAVQSNNRSRVEDILRARPELVHTDLAADNEQRAMHFAVLQRLPEMVRVLMQHGADARQGIYPHRSATSPWTLARERGYHEIVAVIEDEEARRPPAPPRNTPAARTPLEAAVARGDTAWLRHRHSEVPVLNDIHPWHGGLLTLAVTENQPEALAALLEFGLDPDERTHVAGLEPAIENWGFPLWHCAVKGRYAMAALLLAHGADPNAQVYASGTPLMQAYGQGDAPLIELLERHGATPDAAIAGHYRLPAMARQLLAAHGGDPAFIEELLWSAACGGDPEIVGLALARTGWPAGDPRWFRILQQPLRLWNHIPSFWQKPDWDRATYVECFRLVLERSGPHLTGRFGLTPLHDVAATRDYVTAGERTAFASLLLDAGADLTRRDGLLQSTPLGWACRWGRAELVRLLLQRGADRLEPDAEPWATPRAWAEKMGHREIATLLREA